MTESKALEPREKQELQQEGTRPGPVFRPDVDIFEARDGYTVLADLPGADRDSVEVKLEEGVLSLDARLGTAPEASWSPIHTEYRLGDWHREFRVSEDIDLDAVTANVRDGVLELKLPKSAERQPRTIEVRAG